MSPKEYLEKNNIKVKDAAKALGYSRPYISEIINGRPGGRKVAEDWEEWTKGAVAMLEIMFPGGVPNSHS